MEGKDGDSPSKDVSQREHCFDSDLLHPATLPYGTDDKVCFGCALELRSQSLLLH